MPDRVPSDPSAVDAWIDERLEAYLDGDLPPEEAAVLDRVLATSPTWHEQADLARSIRSVLREAPALRCPPAVTETVLRTAWNDVQAASSFDQRLGQAIDRVSEGLRTAWAGWTRWMRPVAVTAALVGAVALAGVLGAPEHASVPETQVAQAREEVAWTLAYVSQMGRRTAEVVRRSDLDASLPTDSPNEP